MSLFTLRWRSCNLCTSDLDLTEFIAHFAICNRGGPSAENKHYLAVHNVHDIVFKYHLEQTVHGAPNARKGNGNVGHLHLA